MALRRPRVRIPLGPPKVLAGVLGHPSASRESEVRARQGAQGARMRKGLNSPAVQSQLGRLQR
jgi:hypothetical protein